MGSKNKFIEIRMALGLLQEELANEMKISRQAISNYERGYNVPAKIRHILNAKFGVNLNWWEDDNEPMFVEKSVEIVKNQPQNVASTAQNGSTIDTLVTMLAEKDRQLIAKDNQLTAKDKQITALLTTINKLQSIIETHLSLPATDMAMAG